MNKKWKISRKATKRGVNYRKLLENSDIVIHEYLDENGEVDKKYVIVKMSLFVDLLMSIYKE